MRKNAWVICCCTAVLAAFGTFFRWLQDQVCFEAETGLAVRGSIWPYAVALMIVIAAVVLAVVCFRMKNQPHTSFPDSLPAAFVAAPRVRTIGGVVLGALLGTAIAVANFFLLGVTLQKAVGMKEYASKYVRQSYSLRMFFCFAGVAVSVFAPCFHPIAAIIPLLMPQLVIYAMRALGLYKPDKPKETPAEAADIDSDLEGDRS